MKKNFWFLAVIFLILLSGCQGQQPTDVPPEETSIPELPTEEAGYPVITRPTATDSGYPISEPVNPNYPRGPEFTIDQPVTVGDTVITGNGPAGVPIKLIDVSEVGLLLGETVIESDGTFTIDLVAPLESNHSIGLQVGDLAGTSYSEEDFLYSPTYYERPLVGILVAMVVVE